MNKVLFSRHFFHLADSLVALFHRKAIFAGPANGIYILLTNDFATMATIFFSNHAVERLGFAFHGEPSVSIQSRLVRTSTFVKGKFCSSRSNESFEDERKLLDNVLAGMNVPDARMFDVTRAFILVIWLREIIM